MIGGIEARHLWLPPASTMETAAPYILDLGPDLYWTLDNASTGLTDQSGNGHDGTAAGGVTIGAGAAIGPSIASTDFDGNDDRATSTHDPFSNANAQTFKTLIHIDLLPNELFEQDVIWKGSGASGPILSITYFSGPSVDLIFEPRGDGGASWTVPAELALSADRDLVIVFDPVGLTAEAFIDGTTLGVEAVAEDYDASPGNFQIGKSSGSVDGKLAHFAIFQRALSAAEILAMSLVGGSTPITLNRRIDDDGVKVFPRYKVTNIGGLSGLGDPEDRRDNRVGAAGEIARRSHRRGKTISYTGRVEAKTRASLRQAEADLRAAFYDQSAEGRMVVTLHPDNPDYVEGEYRYFDARALVCEIEDTPGNPHRITKGHESPFVVAVRNKMRDGVAYLDQDGNEYR